MLSSLFLFDSLHVDRVHFGVVCKTAEGGQASSYKSVMEQHLYSSSCFVSSYEPVGIHAACTHETWGKIQPGSVYFGKLPNDVGTRNVFYECWRGRTDWSVVCMYA